MLWADSFRNKIEKDLLSNALVVENQSCSKRRDDAVEIPVQKSYRFVKFGLTGNRIRVILCLLLEEIIQREKSYYNIEAVPRNVRELPAWLEKIRLLLNHLVASIIDDRGSVLDHPSALNSLIEFPLFVLNLWLIVCSLIVYLFVRVGLAHFS